PGSHCRYTRDRRRSNIRVPGSSDPKRRSACQQYPAGKWSLGCPPGIFSAHPQNHGLAVRQTDGFMVEVAERICEPHRRKLLIDTVAVCLADGVARQVKLAQYLLPLNIGSPNARTGALPVENSQQGPARDRPRQLDSLRIVPDDVGAQIRSRGKVRRDYVTCQHNLLGVVGLRAWRQRY